MLMDDRLEFADAVSVAGTQGTKYLIGDVIDLGSPGFGGVANIANWPGGDEPVYLVIQVTTQMITAGTLNLMKFGLVSDDVSPINPLSCTDHLYTPLIAVDDAAAINAQIANGEPLYLPNQVGGLVICVALPTSYRYQRYLGVIVDLNPGVDITAGAINAFLTHVPSKYVAFADGLPAGS